jgi:hypothetical protein
MVHVASENKCNLSTQSVVASQLMKNIAYESSRIKVKASTLSWTMSGRRNDELIR